MQEIVELHHSGYHIQIKPAMLKKKKKENTKRLKFYPAYNLE